MHRSMRRVNAPVSVCASPLATSDKHQTNETSRRGRARGKEEGESQSRRRNTCGDELGLLPERHYSLSLHFCRVPGTRAVQKKGAHLAMSFIGVVHYPRPSEPCGLVLPTHNSQWATKKYPSCAQQCQSKSRARKERVDAILAAHRDICMAGSVA